MASEVDIVNQALSKLGETTITSLTDDSNEARLANLTFKDYRDTVLRDHVWNFALRRTSIAAVASAPVWEYARAYNLPAEPNYCLRVIDVENLSKLEWKIEGRQILTDLESPINILYIQRMTDPEQFDSYFTETLATYLAAEWAEQLTGSTAMREQLTSLYAAKLASARSVDGQEGTPDVIDACDWLDERF